jgi:hypothetical protein
VSLGFSVVVAFVVWTLAFLSAAETIPRSHQYPDGRTVRFTSWSLFLVCDATWLRSEGKADLIGLYNAYLNLVTTADESHAPLWAFAGAKGWRADEIDPIRIKSYCDSLVLTSGGGPFLVITVHPPGRLTAFDAKILLGFGSLRAKDIARHLNALTEQLSAEGISEAQPGSQEWWSSWERVWKWLRGRSPNVTMSVQPKSAPTPGQ